MPNSKPILVVAAVIGQNGRYLVTKRSPHAKNEPGKWEFPGGKVEAGESPEVALIREIREELGIGISISTPVSLDHHTYKKASGDIEIELRSFLGKIEKGVPRSIMCAEFRFVPSSELHKLDFSAADMPLVARLSSAAQHKKSADGK